MRYKSSYRLFSPGPVNVDPSVAHAAGAYDIGHREEEFSILYKSVTDHALAVAGASPEQYAAVCITGSGTAGNEAVISTCAGAGMDILVASNGEFGLRLAQMAALHSQAPSHVEHEWGEEFDLGRIETALREHRPGLLAVVHHETSTGLINPIKELGDLCRAYDCRLFVDATSSFSADPLPMVEANVSFMSSSSGKALGSFPGISVIIGAHDAFKALPDECGRCRYLDLSLFYKYLNNVAQTPNTPAVPLIMALHQALELILEEGAERRMKRIGGLTHRVRNGLEKLGFTPVIDDLSKTSNTLTMMYLTDDVPYEDLRLGLRQEGFVIYGAKGPFKDRAFQVACLGTIDDVAVGQFLKSVRLVVNGVRARHATKTG